MSRLGTITVAAVAAAAAASVTTAWAARAPGDNGVIKACIGVEARYLTVPDPDGPSPDCHPELEIPLSWNVAGPTGPAGAVGAAGAKGDKGDKGDTGPAGLPGAAAAADTATGLTKEVRFDGRIGQTQSYASLGAPITVGVDLPAGTWAAFARSEVFLDWIMEETDARGRVVENRVICALKGTDRDVDVTSEDVGRKYSSRQWEVFGEPDETLTNQLTFKLDRPARLTLSCKAPIDDTGVRQMRITAIQLRDYSTQLINTADLGIARGVKAHVGGREKALKRALPGKIPTTLLPSRLRGGK